jgi:hypothetical protein
MDRHDILLAGSQINEALTGLTNQINSVEIECYLLSRLIPIQQGSQEPQAFGPLRVQGAQDNRGEL